MSDNAAPFWLTPAPASTLPRLHFSHGNSFPTGTYREFLTCLQPYYQITSLEMIGHNPAYPVTDCWPDLCLELIASLEAGGGQPAILLGHSLGGMLSLMAARMRPDLVRCVLLLDAPVVAGWRASLLKLAKLLGLAKVLSPARFSRKRRKNWPDKASAFAHFAEKEMFAIWPQQVLRDYIEFGMEPHSKGITLHFKREIETAIYLSLPHNNSHFVSQPFPVPVGFLCGTTSEECRQAGIGTAK